MNIAFAGFRHGHIMSLYRWANENPDVNVIGAFEENDEARMAASNDGVVFTYDSYGELLNDSRVEAVAIGDYYGIRGERIIMALNAGRHVVSDKPICTSLAELDEIERISRERNLKIGCMLDLRYTASPNIARDIIRSGRLGAIHCISFGGQHPLNYGKRPSWYFEEGKHGGTINDIAIHGMDLIRYITGAELVRVCAARCWNAYAKDEPHFSDSAQFMAVLDGEIGVIADVSYSLPCGCNFAHRQPWRFTFWGDNGVLEFQCGDGTVELSLAGAESIESISGSPIKSDTVIDFMADINGTPNALDTENVLKSARTVLTIQAAADRCGERNGLNG